jgi:hypothetical protein
MTAVRTVGRAPTEDAWEGFVAAVAVMGEWRRGRRLREVDVAGI